MVSYTGKILWVDLASRECVEEVIPDSIYQKYLSGLGLAAYLLYNGIPADADPLGPENILSFVSGLLTGTPSLFTGRWLVATKSPLTGTWGEANCGGHFSIAIKRCGYDGIFFKGISPTPVYLNIGEKGPELLDATELWGLDTVETETALRELYPQAKRMAIACIGPAGERLSLISGISHDSGRMAARSGVGAVMGSKRLKAVVLHKTGKVNVADRKRMLEITAKTRKFTSITIPLPSWIPPVFGKILRNRWINVRLDGILTNSVLKKWGSSGFFQAFVEWDDAPIKNWLGSHQDYPPKRSKAISAKTIAQVETRKYYCYACPTGCGGILGKVGDMDTSHKPEYETINAFSALVLNDDFESIIKINDMLNRAGMDSISAGATMATAIEWFETGLISSEQTDGLQLNWGNSEALVALIQQMINREGFGAFLADGVRAAVDALNIKDHQAAMHAGGQELAMHDSRLDPGYALHASVEPNPGRHTTGSNLYYDLYRLWTVIPQLPKTPLLSIKKHHPVPDYKDGLQGAATSCYTNFYNTLGVCFYGANLGIDRLFYFDLVNAACGWKLSAIDYLKIGQRIQTLKQLFNLKHGIEPVSIKPSRRALGLPPLKRGTHKNVSLDLEGMRRFYWQAIGWDHENGIPTLETIMTLDLMEQAEALNLPSMVLETLPTQAPEKVPVRRKQPNRNA